MKTTIEIADTLLKEARRVAVRERTTVRALVEEGLRRVVAERNHPSAFRLRRATFRGTGLQPTAATASWQDLRELAYEGPWRVIAVDTNLLVYAHREDSPWHEAAYARIAELAEGRAPGPFPGRAHTGFWRS